MERKQQEVKKSEEKTGPLSTRIPIVRELRALLPHGARKRAASLFIYLRSMALVLVLWHLLYLLMNNPVLLPSPLQVAQSLGQLITSGEIITTAGISLRRLAIGWGLAALISIPLGMLMGLSRYAEDLVDPIVELLRPISGIAWIPLALFFFGIGEQLALFIIFYGAFFPFVLNTVAGVRSTDQVLVRAARTMGMGRWAVTRHVVLPASLPSILTGARLASGAAWMALVAAELLGAQSGLGFSVAWYRGLLQTPNVMAFIVVVGVLGYITDRGLRALQRWLTPWAVSSGEAR